MKLKLSSILLITLIAILFNSCNQNNTTGAIPEEFNPYIHKISDAVAYKEILPFHGKEKEEIPAAISKKEALEDIQLIEYLLTTAYAGYEYWEYNGVDFKSYFSSLGDFLKDKDSVSVDEFESELSNILKSINDGHIAIVGSKYNRAYKHKDIYFCDILVEKTENDSFKVIDSEFDGVKIGDLFTQHDFKKYLFRTLSPPGKDQYLVGILSYDVLFSRKLSFNKKTFQVPFHKSRLLYARFNDDKPSYVERENNIPIVRVTSFADRYYTLYLRKFMKQGYELLDEKWIILNLFNNEGGSSVFPQTFIENLNKQSVWKIGWAILTSPAILQYFAKYDLNSLPDISPSFRQTVIANKKKYEKYRKTPVKSWEFGKHSSQNRYGTYNGTLIILTNRKVLSAAEAMIGYSESVKNRVIIGENSGGVAQFSDVQQYYLPNSKLILKLPRQILLIPDFEEGVGFLPDYWLDSMEPMKEILRWLDNPDNYQFSFTSSYNEMLTKHNLSPILPDDVKIISPGSNVPKAVQAFSGKWFGISDGILDHILVVEKIKDNLEVNAIYSYGVAYPWNINQPGWQRFTGKIQDQKLILTDEKDKIKITYSFNPDSTLDAIYERPGIISHATLIRLDN